MIGFLNAYHFDSADTGYQLEYSRTFFEFLQKTFPEKKNDILEFKVAQGQFPVSVNECEIWFITGSPKSVYEELPWISRLKIFIQQLHEAKAKTIGICFGHQIVAEALGGKVTKSQKGWGVGMRSFELLQGKPWMNPAQQKNMSLLFSHQDQVEELPPGAELLAQNQFCPYQMLQIGEHILTMQGHPEFTVEFAKERLISRKDKMSAETFDQAMKSFSDDSDFLLMIDWIRNFAHSRSKHD